MPYANNETISQKPLTDGIEITDEQYAQARQAKLAGKEIRIISERLVTASDATKTVYSIADGRKKSQPDNFPVEDGYTESARPDEFHNWENGKWVLDEAAQRQASIPTSISSRQGKIALLGAGLLDNVEAALDAIVDPTEKRIALIEYNHVVWNFDSPFLQSFWTSFGGTQAQLEDLFIQASTL